MKKWAAAAVVSALLLLQASGTLAAEPEHPADSLKTESTVMPAELMDKSLAGTVPPDISAGEWKEVTGDVFKKDVLPKHVSYHPLDEKGGSGILLYSHKGKSAEMLVSAITPGNVIVKKGMEGFFLSGDRMTLESSRMLAEYNQSLYGMEDKLNGFFLETIKALRTDEAPIPYDFVNVSVAKLHRGHVISLDPRIFSSEFRMTVIVDGYMIPVYTKQYLYKNNGQPEIMVIMARDSDNRLAAETGDGIVKKLAAK